MLGFSKKENTAEVEPPNKEMVMPAPPPNGRGPAPKKLPEMHVNIFAFMGQDIERVKQTVKEIQESFGQEYMICVHINFNQPRKQVGQNDKRRENGI